MAYAKKTAPPAVAGQPAVNFGGQAFDANRTPLGSVDSGFITQDATGTPKTSPQSATTAADIALIVPSNATSVVISTSAFAVDVSELAGHSQYMTVPVGAVATFDVARQGTLYLRGNGGTAVATFAFQLVD